MNNDPTTEQRLTALEQHVAALEQRLARLEQPTRKPRARRKSRRRDMIPLDRFTAQHNVNYRDVERAISMEVLRPDTIALDDGNEVLMLDSEGRRQFWEALHDAGTWTDCPICPHELY